MMYLFSRISYSIGGNELEAFSHPGHTTSIMNYLSQPDDYSTSAGLKSCWCKDTSTHADSNEFGPSPATAANVDMAAGRFASIKNLNYNQGFAARRNLLMGADPRGSFSFVIPLNTCLDFLNMIK